MPIFWLTRVTRGGGRSLDVLAVAELVDRDRGLVAVRDGPDDVLRAERGVAAEEDVRQGRLHGRRVDNGHAPAVELDADVALDPGKGVLLPDRDQHVVAREVHVGLAGRDELAAALARRTRPSTFSNSTPVSRPPSCVNSFGTRQLRIGMPSCIASSFSQGDAFISSKPLRTTTCTSSPPRRRDGAAAIHRRVAAAEHDDAAADLVDMAERDAGQPVDADMDVGRGLLCGRGGRDRARAARRSRRRPRPSPGEQRLQAVDGLPERGSRRRCRGCSRPPRRSRFPAAGTAGSASASCRRPWRRRRRARSR